MSKGRLPSDFRFVLNGLKKVMVASAEIRKADYETKLANSSLKVLAEDLLNLPKNIVPENPKDILERSAVFPKGVHQFVVSVTSHALKQMNWAYGPNKSSKSQFASEKNATAAQHYDFDDLMFIREEDLESAYVKSLGVEIMQQNEDGKEYMKQFEDFRTTTTTSPIEEINFLGKKPKRASSEVVTGSETLINDSRLQDILKAHAGANVKSSPEPQSPKEEKPWKKLGKAKPLSKTKPNSQIGATSKARRVPASRLSRLVSYGGLAAGLGIGALTEMTKRSLGLAKQDSDNPSLLDSSPFLSEANAERIVDTLCRVRGAALKLGQILSIQDNSMINPQLQRAFERVRHSADFMPSWQMERVMVAEFGPEWRSKFNEFDEKPFAAASIGQVHMGKLQDGRPVAVKIQYPGVAQGIESDIDNLVAVFGIWNMLPQGIFADKIIEVAKRELRWEVDYIRESECAKRFRKLLQNHPDYYVPEVVDELTTKQVYTTELIEGLSVDKFANLDQETRDRISYLLLDLFFREIFEYRFMQTDPNWSNFLYNQETKQIGLLDFGASREFRKEFVDNYLQIFKGAATHDVAHVLKYSRDIGFLTGYESKAMENAHVDTVMILGEAFRIGDNYYEFGKQNITQRIQELVPVMVKERLCPPPEEIYSLHRKLSGVFLLCAKLQGRVKCRPIFERIWNEYKFGPEYSSEINSKF